MMVYSRYRRAFRKRKVHTFNRRHVWVFFLIIITIILLVLKITSWLGAQELFHLKELKIEGNRFIKNDEILKYLEIDSSRGIFNIDLKASENRIKKHPLIEQVSVSRHLPSTLKIKILEKKPIAVVSNSKLFAIDEYGSVLPKINPAIMCDYPIISNLKVKIDKSNHLIKSFELTKILDYLRFLKIEHPSLYSRISEISFSKQMGVYFYLNDGAVPVLLGIGSLNIKSANLETVLKFLEKTNKTTQIEYFDLRFKSQVIIKERS